MQSLYQSDEKQEVSNKMSVADKVKELKEWVAVLKTEDEISEEAKEVLMKKIQEIGMALDAEAHEIASMKKKK